VAASAVLVAGAAVASVAPAVLAAVAVASLVAGAAVESVTVVASVVVLDVGNPLPSLTRRSSCAGQLKAWCRPSCKTVPAEL
jgi:hypothetical protein